MRCPACSEDLTQIEIESCVLFTCVTCEGAVVDKAVMRPLSQLAPSLHPLLSERDVKPDAHVARVRTCGCGQAMLSHAYRGGNVRAEACEGCDRLFFERGELGCALHEMRSGSELTEEAHQGLHLFRVRQSFDRFSNAQVAFGAAGLMAALLALQLAGAGRKGALLSAPIALAVGLALFVLVQRRAGRTIADESKRLDRLGAAEEWRRAKPAMVALSNGSPKGGPATQPTRACPFCRAQLSSESSHCTACDSDFG